MVSRGDPGLSSDGSASEPLLTLCLPTYNRARYLPKYLEHHLNAFEAAGLDYELVVSDNASTDETPEILRRYAERYPRLRVSRQPHNVGMYANMLSTYYAAKGKFLVSIADDDLAIVDPLLNYVRRLAEDPDLVMIQAPWLMVDEKRGGTVIGQFYKLDSEQRFAREEYASCLAFLIERHVFPECWILRRSALPRVVGSNYRFTYFFFAMLANALQEGDVLFSPTPHIRAIAVSEHGHVGDAEAMESWDRYRGGLELIASYARQFRPGSLREPSIINNAVTGFVNIRMGVAARLHAQAGNWLDAYQLLRRLDCYEARPAIGFPYGEVSRLAALEAAIAECAQLGALHVVFEDGVSDDDLRRLRPPTGVTAARESQVSPDDPRRAYCGFETETPPASLRPTDFIYALDGVRKRFPALQG